MNATYAQIDYLRSLAKEIHGDEYWVNERLGFSRSSNLAKMVTRQQASELIDELKTQRGDMAAPVTE